MSPSYFIYFQPQSAHLAPCLIEQSSFKNTREQINLWEYFRCSYSGKTLNRSYPKNLRLFRMTQGFERLQCGYRFPTGRPVLVDGIRLLHLLLLVVSSLPLQCSYIYILKVNHAEIVTYILFCQVAQFRA